MLRPSARPPSNLQLIEYFNAIAQEFAQVFPDYVKNSGDPSGEGDELLQVDTYPALMHAIAAIQELAEQNRQLVVRNGELLEGMGTLASRIAALENE